MHLTPSPQKLLFLWCFPYISNAIPRNATGHGRGGGEYPTKLRRDKTVQSDTFNPLPLLIADEIGGVPEGRGG